MSRPEATHVANCFDLGEHEQQGCWLLMNRARSLLQDRVVPTKITVGLNLEEMDSSWTHTHIHLIPR